MHLPSLGLDSTSSEFLGESHSLGHSNRRFKEKEPFLPHSLNIVLTFLHYI